MLIALDINKYGVTDSINKIKISLLREQLNNYQTLHKQDSIHLMYLDENVMILNQRIKLYVDLTKELEPKWFKKPAVHFLLGVATIVTSSWVVSNIK